MLVYCTIGERSGRCTQRLQREGFEAYNLPGGILAWVHAGRPLVDPRGAITHRVHVYGEEWNLAPREYQTVW